MVHFHLDAVWFEQIKRGQKEYEFRKASKYWWQRVRAATHVSFERGTLAIQTFVCLSTVEVP